MHITRDMNGEGRGRAVKTQGSGLGVVKAATIVFESTVSCAR